MREYVDANTDDPAEVLERVGGLFQGVDLDPVAVWIGNMVLAAELLTLWTQVKLSDLRAP